MNGNSASRITLNLGCGTDLQFLETITPDHTTSPHGLALRGHRSIRAAPDPRNAGLFFDRVPLRALANALLSAGNTTDLATSVRSE
jgi:hypothetical protein